MVTKKYLDDLEYQITGACIDVHKHLGPGLLESVYQECLAHELRLRQILFSPEHTIDVVYKGFHLDTALRVDFLINNCLVMEIKAVDSILPIHEAQLLTYMKLLKTPKGLLINFNCTNIIQNGKKPYVN
ncbi:GxxExxY protein [Dyadobacter sp. CY345]|uniref:GxxExxY protein n=1 Tax=Dyadobacter sp. CY345 TaxID=2909335 RepID=UPI001F3D72E0|nr:GxxExxY protein [Dyadobacter sp. CY345]MCF2442964.1 GxxExxY protein [Dyadobacter sp. CY345]